MGIVMIVIFGLLGTVYLVWLLYLSRKNKFENMRLNDTNKALEESIDNLKADNNRLEKELGDARSDIWEYEVGTKNPTQKARISEMREYIFHLLQKQNTVMGLNDRDKEWIRRLGGQLKQEVEDE